MAYGYYRSIEINAAAVGANETNFPVALVLTDGAFRAFLPLVARQTPRHGQKRLLTLAKSPTGCAAPILASIPTRFPG